MQNLKAKCHFVLILLFSINTFAVFSSVDEEEGQGGHDQATLEVLEFMARPKKLQPDQKEIQYVLSYGVRARAQDSFREGETSSTHRRTQQQIKLLLTIPLNEYTSVHLHGQTGSESFGGGWDNQFDLGDDSDGGFGFRLRRAFVHYDNKETKILAQAGAIPVASPSSIRANLQVDRDGWLDGFRLGLNEIMDKNHNINISFGNLNRSAPASVYNRDVFKVSDYDYIQIEIQGAVTDNIAYQLQYDDFDGEEYISGIIQSSVNKMTSALFDIIQLETIYSLDSSGIVGKTLTATKFHNDKKISVGLSQNELEFERNEYTNGFFDAPGTSIFAMIQGDLFNTDLSYAGRVRYCISPSECMDSYRLGIAIRGKTKGWF
ncbi:MAG: hypothetical protein AB8E15_13995 [Bdellovibrionales bacterium]